MEGKTIEQRVERIEAYLDYIVKATGIKAFEEQVNANHNNQDVQDVVNEFIHKLRIPANIKGYNYLRTAITMVAKDMSLINNITKKLYPNIADLYNTTSSRVERAMRHAIEISWMRCDKGLQREIFSYTNDSNMQPKNSEFIAMVAEKVREEMGIHSFSGSDLEHEQQINLDNNEFNLAEFITEYIHKLRIPANIQGYNYLRTAVMMVVNDINLINKVTIFLYPKIAKEYNTTKYCVERSIRHAISVAWKRGDKKTQLDIFGYTNESGSGYPTNSEFIAMLADRISLEMRINK